jgi:hypothetical protein
MAWDETLLGHALRWKGGQENVRQAIIHYERALELERCWKLPVRRWVAGLREANALGARLAI